MRNKTLLDSVPTLRERKKIATRDALANAATRLALRRGLENLRVEDIAAEANVSLRTFRNYFANKEEALTARYMDRMKYAAAVLDNRPQSEPLWVAVNQAILGQWEGVTIGTAIPKSSWLKELRVIYGAPAVQAEILRTSLLPDHPFSRAVANRTRTDSARDLYPRLITAVVTSATQAAINIFLASDPPVALVPLLKDALDQIAAGLPAPDGGKLKSAGIRSESEKNRR